MDNLIYSMVRASHSPSTIIQKNVVSDPVMEESKEVRN